jgi:hypothetical protein
VSLILDALKKLERDKDAREPNVLVVGSVPWGTRARSRLPLVVAIVAAGLVALVALALWMRAPRPVAPPALPVASTPAAPATPIASAMPPRPTAASSAALAAPEPRRPSLPPDRTQAPDRGATATRDTATRDGSGPDDLRLNAISQRNGRPVALINDRLVFEGEGFDGMKVLHIGETEVEVEVRGVKRVLRF